MGVAVGMEEISTIVDHGDGEEPLIDFESEGDGPTQRTEMILDKRRVGEGMSPTSAMTPGDKLRELLHMMETEVREAKPARAESQVRIPSPVRRDPARRAEERQAAWRLRRSALARDERGERDEPRSEGEASGSDLHEHDRLEEESEQPDGGHTASGALSPPRGAATDDSEESPPSPPMRISNPYRHARMSLERRTPTPPHRSVQGAGEGLAGKLHPHIFVRCIVDIAGPSRSPRNTARGAPTPLQSFIASHPSVLSPRGSRKGKERASASASVSPASVTGTAPRKSYPVTPGPSRREHASRPSLSSDQASDISESDDGDGPSTVRRPSGAGSRNAIPPITPRRWSVELAPDDSALFAEEVQGLEVAGEVELDLDEGMSGARWDTETEESGAEEGGVLGDTAADVAGQVDSEERPGEASFDRTTRITRAGTAGRGATTQSPNQSSTPNSSGRLSRIISSSRSPLEQEIPGDTDMSLPALPEPETPSVDDEMEFDTLSSRRAALFRASSKSPRASQSPSFRKSASASASVSPSTPVSLPRKASQSPFAMTPSPVGPGPKASPRAPAASPPRRVTPRSHSRSSSTLQDPSASFPQPPIAVHLTLTDREHQQESQHTPQRVARVSGSGSSVGVHANTTISGSTPHPPGWLSASGHTARNRNVRFSPLRQHDGEWSLSVSKESEEMSGSVHRLKLSPAKERSGRGLSSSPSKDHRGSPLKSVAGLQGDEPADEVLEADTSFTGRLSALSRAVTGR
jgi:hypothetical protein